MQKLLEEKKHLFQFGEKYKIKKFPLVITSLSSEGIVLRELKNIDIMNIVTSFMLLNILIAIYTYYQYTPIKIFIKPYFVKKIV